MKKQLFYVLALSCVMCLVSCDKEKDKVKEEKKNEEVKENLTILRQQALIEQSMIDFSNAIPASDLEGLRAFINEVVGIADSMDYKNVYLKDSLRQTFRFREDSISVLSRDKYPKADKRAFSVMYIDSVSVIERCIFLSNLKGHYVATDSLTWVYSKADDLQFIFKDSLNNDCVLSITHSGKDVKVKSTYGLSARDTMPERIVRAEGDSVFYIDRHVKRESSMIIPEKMVLSLSKNDVTAATLTLNTKLENLADGYFDVGKSAIGLELIFESATGFKMVAGAEYVANSKLSMNYAINKNGINAMSFKLATEPKGFASFELRDEDETQMLIDSTKNYTDSINAQKLYLSLSFMDEVQIAGSISDIRDYIALNDSIKKVYAVETAYKSLIEKMNEAIDFHVSFEGYKEEQAKLELEPECKVTYENGHYIDKWSHNYVMVLADGSKASVGEFMNVEQYEVGLMSMIRTGVQYSRMIRKGEANTEKNFVNNVVVTMVGLIRTGFSKIGEIMTQLEQQYNVKIDIRKK